MNFIYFASLISLIGCLFCTSCDFVRDKKAGTREVSVDDLSKLSKPIEDEREHIAHLPNISASNTINTIPSKYKQPVSLMINDVIPIKSVLYETANKLNINIQMDAAIESNFIFRANNKPFIEVIDAICDAADLRYSIDSDILKIEKDTPYSKTYDLQCLNLSRDSENRIAIATDVNGTSSNNDNNQPVKTISGDSTVVVKATNDFWGELSDSIKIMLAADPKYNFSINKQTGIVTVFANTKTQQTVQKYLDEIKEVNNAQVLIEAKIIEVVLKNEYKRGINWNILLDESVVNGNFSDLSPSNVAFSYKGQNVEGILRALEQFGAIRTVSNPRITAMNNQAAVLKIAQNHVYFKLNYDKTFGMRDVSREEVNVSSDIKTIPIGLVMFVQPSIDVRNRTVSLFLRPTITKLTDTVSDPAVDIALKAIDQGKNSSYTPSKVPITEVREVASVMNLADGEVAVLGGFMEVLSSKEKSGLPLFKDIPIFGETVSDYGAKDQIVELVILIKVRIMGPRSMQRAADIRLQRFVSDPRPF